jgi:hypothetical protein
MTPELVSVSLHRDGTTAEYRLRPADPDLGGLLASMGFAPQDGVYVRSFPDSDDMPRLFERFTAHVDEMIRHKRRDVPAPWEAALDLVAERLSGAVGWWLSGSATLALQGYGVEPRDLDLVVEDASRAGELLHDVLIEPVRRMEGWVADWHGRAFDQALIEWVAGLHAPAGRLEPVLWRGRRILCD